MRRILALALALTVFAEACTSASPPATPASDASEIVAPAEPASVRVEHPETLADFLPDKLGERAPNERDLARDAPSGTWTLDDHTVRIALRRVDDLPKTRAALELLGQPVQAVMNDEELRGLRVQGNPAQLRRQLDPPHRARLDVIAVSTYHIQITVEPAPTLDTPLSIAEHLDIGSMTLLALREHKARRAAADPDTSAPPPTDPEAP